MGMALQLIRMGKLKLSRNDGEKGFTLIESLLVLTIFSIIICISFLALKPHYAVMEKNYFFTQLKSDLLYAQNYSLTMQIPVTVNFFPSSHYYYINLGNEKISIERYYSENINVEPGTMPLYFRFNPKGNINQFGSFYVEIHGEKYRFTFLIGKGRFYVVKV